MRIFDQQTQISFKKFLRKMKRKMKELNWRKVVFILWMIQLIQGIVALFLGLFVYMVSLHNIDLILNMFLITNDINRYFFNNNITTFIDIRRLNDTTAGFINVNYLESYILSSNLQLKAIFIMAASGAVIGFCLMGLLSCGDE